MAITAVSGCNSAALMLKELGPYCKEGACVAQPSGEGHIVIIEDPQKNPLCFQICWKLKDGTERSAPFWADAFRGKWCFLNGNPHSFDKLQEMVADILNHLRNGDVMSPKQTATYA